MKLHFYGADREVTGSRHLLEVNGKKILLDCGLFQGRRDEEKSKNANFGFEPKDIDAVVISHAHIDHSGNLPNLVKQGFRGPIYCTHATADLLEYMLMDSAFIQEKEVEYLNEKKEKAGEELVEPLYTIKDVEQVLPMLKSVHYEECVLPFKTDDIKICFHEAGHILGSSITEFTIKDQADSQSKTLVFTGDLGRKNMPLIEDPYQVPHADYLLMESTYGNRLHDSIEDAEEELGEIIKTTAQRGGRILIPAFSLGRTQEIVYSIHQLMDEGKIPLIPVYLDSPLSVKVTDVFRRHLSNLDEDTRNSFLKKCEDPFKFDQLHSITSVDESKGLNNQNGPCIIISASGMCEHGRILHHLKNAIEDHRNTLIIVGFQAQHTLGRKIVEKEPIVNIFGKPYPVKIEVKIMNAYSAHADRNDLIEFATHVQGLKKLILVHGEEQSALDLQKVLLEKGIPEVIVPAFGDTVEL